MTLFTLTDTIEEFKCASGSKKTLLDPNGGQIQVSARWGSQKEIVIIDSPKYLWSAGYKMPISLTLTPPTGKFVEKPTVGFKASADDYEFKAEWLVEEPPVASKPTSGGAFGESEMAKPIPQIEQLGVDLAALNDKMDLVLSALGDLIN